jgi:hypothetical protein
VSSRTLAVAERAALATVAVVLAGGSGSRVGLGLPKQLLKIAGKTVLEHTLDALHRSEDADEILLVITPAFLDRTKDLLQNRYPKLMRMIAGAGDLNESTRMAIRALEGRECNVLFHDTVRPLVDRARSRPACGRSITPTRSTSTSRPPTRSSSSTTRAGSATSRTAGCFAGGKPRRRFPTVDDPRGLRAGKGRPRVRGAGRLLGGVGRHPTPDRAVAAPVPRRRRDIPAAPPHRDS